MPRFPIYLRVMRCITLPFSLFLVAAASGQNPAPPQVLTQIAQAFSAGNPVTQVQLAGTATWHAGSTVDSGSATLTANASGQASMTLSLDSKGAWTESQTAFGSGMTCQWSGADGVPHQGDFLNCLRPVVWFLPSVSLQEALLAPALSVTDLGVGELDSGSYRHLQAAAALPDVPSDLAPSISQWSTTDIGLDPSTLLPTVLSYAVRPDSGAATPVAIEVRYSNYQRVSGVMIPFSIERYVNGSLQLDIEIASAQIN